LREIEGKFVGDKLGRKMSFVRFSATGAAKTEATAQRTERPFKMENIADIL